MPSSKKQTDTPLTLSDFQVACSKTDRTGVNAEDGTLVAVLGIVGEAGDLATLFKKKLRDGDGYTVYPEQCAEELGDILWYVATLCSKLSLNIDDVARSNLLKTQARWTDRRTASGARQLLDERYETAEQIPRQFSIKFIEKKHAEKRVSVELSRDGKPCGNLLTDNAYSEDGYRFHDVFHLAYAAVLGWSPVTRKLLGCKRRSKKNIDEIEDGGRAAVIEESISALVFQYAANHNNLDGIGRIDSGLLSLLQGLTKDLEVQEASAGEWELAIMEGYRVFRLLNRERGGVVAVDLIARNLGFNKLPRTAK
jgi:NTP pyrophosphatase (non-canonical NTP hydrolase)